MDDLFGALPPWLLVVGAGGLGVYWNSLKGFFTRLVQFVICEAHLTDMPAAAFIGWAEQNCWRTGGGTRDYIAWYQFVIKPASFRYILYRRLGEVETLYWRRGLPILVGRKAQQKTEGDLSSSAISVRYLRGTLNIERVLSASLRPLNEDLGNYACKRHVVHRIIGKRGNKEVSSVAISSGSRTVIVDPVDRRRFIPIGYSYSELGSDINSSSISVLALSNEQQEVFEELRRWKDSREWFQERGVPWRRGYVLYGPPGGGKTSFVRASAADLDLPVYVYMLSSLCNEELVDAWERMLCDTPCIALFEDLDTVFEGRRCIVPEDHTKSNLTFDTLLNCIDGVERANGLITFISTNRVETLDPAIGRPDAAGNSSRPGRVDRLVRCDYLDEDGRWKLARRIMAGLGEDAIAEMVASHGQVTPSAFVNYCVEQAMKFFWDDQLETSDGETILRRRRQQSDDYDNG